MPEARRIQITNDLDIVAARVEGRNLAKEMGFGIIDQSGKFLLVKIKKSCLPVI